jgi:two-component system sensor histidine kinase AlgZ
MKDSQLLSAFAEPSSAPQPTSAPPLVFDACQIGVVLRAVLFVEAVMAVAAMFGSSGLLGWVTRLALLTGGAFPAVLVWLLAACLFKRILALLQPLWQVGAGAALGALAGWYGCGVLVVCGFQDAPPWLASACSGALLAALVVRDWVQRLQRRAPADTAARLAELQSRIRPHFLFNTLNSAIALVRAEPAKAEALLEDLSELFRHALRDPDAVVTLAEEVFLAQRYLAIEQVRFGERLRVEWDLDPAADPARLPSLVLQPLVENAVRHGVEPSASGAHVLIRTQRRGSMVVLKVQNSVPAGVGVEGAGVALQNVRERLALLHDVEGHFQCGLKDGVYQVRVEVPL